MPDTSTTDGLQLAPIDLCASNALEEGGLAQMFDVLWRGEALRGFALRFEGRVVGYLNRCAHVAAEMDWQPGEFFSHDGRWIVCSLHGAHYEPADGLCIAGPCTGARLMALDVREEAGRVRWYPSRDLQPVIFDDAEGAHAPEDRDPPAA